MAGVIDADTHIFESPEVWEFMDEEMYPRRPVIVTGPEGTAYRRTRFWLIDGNILPKPIGKGGFLLGTPTDPSVGTLGPMPDVRARELLDIDGRLQAMDQMGVERQVIYPTLFLIYLTDDVKLDVALCRCYNRFMAATTAKAQGRLSWLLAPPLRSIDATIEEMNLGKEKGAVGLFFRGIEKDRTLGRSLLFSGLRGGPAPRPSHLCPYRGWVPGFHQDFRCEAESYLFSYPHAPADGLSQHRG